VQFNYQIIPQNYGFSKGYSVGYVAIGKPNDFSSIRKYQFNQLVAPYEAERFSDKYVLNDLFKRPGFSPNNRVGIGYSPKSSLESSPILYSKNSLESLVGQPVHNRLYK